MSKKTILIWSFIGVLALVMFALGYKYFPLHDKGGDPLVNSRFQINNTPDYVNDARGYSFELVGLSDYRYGRKYVISSLHGAAETVVFEDAKNLPNSVLFIITYDYSLWKDNNIAKLSDNALLDLFNLPLEQFVEHRLDMYTPQNTNEVENITEVELAGKQGYRFALPLEYRDELTGSFTPGGKSSAPVRILVEHRGKKLEFSYLQEDEEIAREIFDTLIFF